VFYGIPENDISVSPVLFVMHGTSRDADRYAESFLYLTETENIIIIAPEFTREQFPNPEYQRIGIAGNINNPEKWTSKIIDDIYLDFCRRFDVPVGKYIMYGHSAGSQFTLRSLMFCESDYLDYAIAANAGTYTFPDDRYNYEYGIKNLIPQHRDLINRNFGKRLYILTGNQDIDPEHPDLTRSESADRQGIQRHERALNFFQASRDYCIRNNIPFNWDIMIMDGVGHSRSPTRPYVIDIITGKYGGFDED
jgi:hypothetical protein